MLINDRYDYTGAEMRGGMASVLQCMDKVLERPVAIKVMPGTANSRRLKDEIGALLKMRSKHVVQVFDLLKINGNDLGIVQEFINGRDLFDPSLYPQDTMSYLRLVWQIASGISDIHEAGLIHRDIKPNNMKVDPEGVVKIFDFGLARQEGVRASTMGFVGTPGFAAPELYADSPVFTAAVDTYAFGATALFLGLPRCFDEVMAGAAYHVNDDFFSHLPFGLPQEILGTLRSCMAWQENSRPKMSEVRDVLSKHLLAGRHRALLVFQKKASFLSDKNRVVSLRLPPMGEVEIQYNGFDFTVSAVSGNVYINNNKVSIGDVLPGACVVTLGAPEYGNQRRYITFDLSHPEIVL